MYSIGALNKDGNREVIKKFKTNEELDSYTTNFETEEDLLGKLGHDLNNVTIYYNEKQVVPFAGKDDIDVLKIFRNGLTDMYFNCVYQDITDPSKLRSFKDYLLNEKALYSLGNVNEAILGKVSSINSLLDETSSNKPSDPGYIEKFKKYFGELKSYPEFRRLFIFLKRSGFDIDYFRVSALKAKIEEEKKEDEIMETMSHIPEDMDIDEVMAYSDEMSFHAGFDTEKAKDVRDKVVKKI